MLPRLVGGHAPWLLAGLDVGSGYLHTLPVKCRSTVGKNCSYSRFAEHGLLVLLGAATPIPPSSDNDPNASPNPFLAVSKTTETEPVSLLDAHL